MLLSQCPLNLAQSQLRSVLSYCFKNIKRHLSLNRNWCAKVLCDCWWNIHFIGELSFSVFNKNQRNNSEERWQFSMKLLSASPCLLDACTKPPPPWTLCPGTLRCTASMASRQSATPTWSSPERRSDPPRASQSLRRLHLTHWACLPQTLQYLPSNWQQTVPRNSQENRNLHHQERILSWKAQNTELNPKMMQQLLKLTILRLTSAVTTTMAMELWVQRPRLNKVGISRRHYQMRIGTTIRSPQKLLITIMVQQKLQLALKHRFESNWGFSYLSSII